MTILVILLFLLSVSNIHSLFFSLDGPKSTDTYGPYDLIWKNCGACASSEASIAQIYMKIYDEMNTSKLMMQVHFPRTVRVDELRIVVYSIKNKLKHKIWNYKIDKPCQHEILVDDLWKRMSSHNCIVKKGDYNGTVNISESINKFYGSSFFYGEYMFKASLMSAKQVVICMMFHEKFVKKQKEAKK